MLDSAAHMPKSLVVDPTFDWAGDVAPRTTYADSVIYEVHVKGFTATHPGVPPELRGTYAGLAHPAAVAHLTSLGVTAVELLPVHEFITASAQARSGLSNYWGYNTIGFFAPLEEYSAAFQAGWVGGQVREFQQMVLALHAAGIEVILDVVYNHTAEGDQFGPTLCFRGIDNHAYYRVDPADPSRYLDTTGTGNSYNVDDHTCLRLIMDSLRYWVTEMHVDGFRFDLATALAREDGGFERLSSFFALVDQDPVISRVKLIAEPWDVGQWDSYSVGAFPDTWSEWNGRYRDTIRAFWSGRPGVLPELATRVAGSSDIYGPTRRRPHASINYVTCHDGFTLRDLVSYTSKHNEANGEDNRDGTNDNISWNHGVEGPQRRPGGGVRASPGRAGRAHDAVPVPRGPDAPRRRRARAHPTGEQQRLLPGQRDLLVRLGARRRRPAGVRPARDRDAPGAPGAAPAPVPGRPRVLRVVRTGRSGDVARRCGRTRLRHSVAVFVDGSVAPDRDRWGEHLLDHNLLVLVNGEADPVEFRIPDTAPAGRPSDLWRLELDTSLPGPEPASTTLVRVGETVLAPGRSLLVHWSAWDPVP